MVLLILSTYRNINKVVFYLHSNMVLLILQSCKIRTLWSKIYIPIWFYLYLINSFLPPKKVSNLHSNMVLLISFIFCKTLCKELIIYIPIWFYLYLSRFVRRKLYIKIYIPIWFYLSVYYKS